MAWQLRSRRPLPGAVAGAGGWVLTWERCAVMGIVNVTPDSFSDGGVHADHASAIAHARRLRDEGALVVDVGGESTRPGARPVPAEVEADRVVPVVRALVADGDVVVSVDTRKPEVAAAAIDAGAHLVNDIGGLRDPAMLAVCARTGTPAVLMHMQGEPRTMQADPHYDDVVAEVTAFLRVQADRARAAGVPSVLVDPGIGFGKTAEHNLTLLAALPLVPEHPVLVGASRKRFIGQLTGRSVPAERDAGSIAVHLHAAAAGVAMVRVHEVAGHVDALAVWHALARPTA